MLESVVEYHNEIAYVCSITYALLALQLYEVRTVFQWTGVCRDTLPVAIRTRVWLRNTI